MSDSVRPHRRQPTRLPRPWDSPGKNTGVGCHFLLQCRKVKSESEVTQSCPTLSDPTDCSPPGSSVHGIFQAGVLEWGAIAFSNPILPWTRSMKSIIFENNPNDYTISHGREILEVFLEVSINGDLKKSKKPQMKSFVSQGTLKNIVAFLVA